MNSGPMGPQLAQDFFHHQAVFSTRFFWKMAVFKGYTGKLSEIAGYGFFPDSWEGYYQKVGFPETFFLDARFMGCPSICLSSKNPGVMKHNQPQTSCTIIFFEDFFSKMTNPNLQLLQKFDPPKKWAGISWCSENFNIQKPPQGQQLNPPRSATQPPHGFWPGIVRRLPCPTENANTLVSSCKFTPRQSGPLWAL